MEKDTSQITTRHPNISPKAMDTFLQSIKNMHKGTAESILRLSDEEVLGLGTGIDPDVVPSMLPSGPLVDIWARNAEILAKQRGEIEEYDPKGLAVKSVREILEKYL